ncbi:hypothetical protein [Ideonella sp. YS5]|uniref:hypothetical protein n=1 Tax=Ideonella sp. YS5 TaxID=3453714 RepID=UPI003EEC45BF
MRRVATALYVAIALASLGLASVQPSQADGLAVNTVALADEVDNLAVDVWDAAADTLAPTDTADTP